MATLCDSSHVKLAAGANVSTAITGAQYTTLINQAEAQLISDTGIDWVSAYNAAAIPNNFSGSVQLATAAMSAVGAINHDPGTYSSLNEAATMINVNLNRYNRAVGKLKDDNVKTAFGGTAYKLKT